MRTGPEKYENDDDDGVYPGGNENDRPSRRTERSVGGSVDNAVVVVVVYDEDGIGKWRIDEQTWRYYEDRRGLTTDTNVRDEGGRIVEKIYEVYKIYKNGFGIGVRVGQSEYVSGRKTKQNIVLRLTNRVFPSRFQVFIAVFVLVLQMLTMRSNNGLSREHDRQVRLHSVRTDLELDLPPRIHLPDGEEYPYGSMAKLHLRNSEQV